MTPEEIVDQAVASAALEGVRISLEWHRILLRVAKAELSADDAVAQVIADAVQ